jgi:hypothetical protein
MSTSAYGPRPTNSPLKNFWVITMLAVLLVGGGVTLAVIKLKKDRSFESSTRSKITLNDYLSLVLQGKGMTEKECMKYMGKPTDVDYDGEGKLKSATWKASGDWISVFFSDGKVASTSYHGREGHYLNDEKLKTDD